MGFRVSGLWRVEGLGAFRGMAITSACKAKKVCV